MNLSHRTGSTPFDLLHMYNISTSCKDCTWQLVRPSCRLLKIFPLQAILLRVKGSSNDDYCSLSLCP